MSSKPSRNSLDETDLDLERFIDEVEAAGDEFVDVLDVDPFEDTDLTGRRRRSDQ